VSILVDILEEDLSLLQHLSQQRNLPVSQLLKEAIQTYLEPNRLPAAQAAHKAIEAGFGAWKDHPVDGMAYQERIRGEW
jgi:hypothetical protein